MLDHDADRKKIARAFLDGNSTGGLYWLTGTGTSSARIYWVEGRSTAAAIAAGQQPAKLTLEA
jgi:hypothetical protein